MPKRTRMVIGGVDTHGRTHHAAVLDEQGRLLGDREFPADQSGYRQLLSWLGRHGQVEVVGGAGLAHYLGDQRVRVVEVDRPDRRTRRQRGRSDPIDAEAAARAVLAGTATAVPKRRDGSWRRSACCGPPAGVPARPAPPRSTSSRRWWSLHQPRFARRSTTCPRRRWSPLCQVPTRRG